MRDTGKAEKLLDLASQAGVEVEPIGTERFVFSDHEYVEIVCELPPHPAPVQIGQDPMVIIRPEGAWDEPGVLEASAARPATNPTGDESGSEDWADKLRGQMNRLG